MGRESRQSAEALDWKAVVVRLESLLYAMA
jgi:hypothetical protein